MITPEYLAGLFDGEGTIVTPRTQSRAISTRVAINMAVIAAPLLVDIHSTYGGHFYPHKNKGVDMLKLRWHTSEEVIYILGVMIPHLKIKVEQAKLAVWWCKNCCGPIKATRWEVGEASNVYEEKMKLMKKDLLIKSETIVEVIDECFSARKIIPIGVSNA